MTTNTNAKTKTKFGRAGGKIILAGGIIILAGGKIIFSCGKITLSCGKIILAGGKIILAGGKIVLECVNINDYFVRWEITLAGLVTNRQSHPVRTREFLIPKKNQKRNLIHRFTNTVP